MSVEKVLSQIPHHNYEFAQTMNQAEGSEYKQSIKEAILENQNENQSLPSKNEMERVIEGINRVLQPSNTHIQFELHEKLNEYYVTIVDNNTSEVLREIPSRKWLDIYAAMTDFVGLIVDKKI